MSFRNITVNKLKPITCTNCRHWKTGLRIKVNSIFAGDFYICKDCAQNLAKKLNKALE